MTAPGDTRARRAQITALIRAHRIGTQAELRERLRARGHAVTQATLSRDLARLRARRVTLPGGGTAYELDAAGDDRAREAAVAALVVDVRDGAAMVVIHTRPGGAPAVAAWLDDARVASVLGSIAGDDTIFIVPERRVTAAALALALRRRLAGAAG